MAGSGAYTSFMGEITRILERSTSGDASAASELLPLVYEELRKLAAARMSAERSDHTLQSTALVHEAYLRLVQPAMGHDLNGQEWDGRAHFFAAAAEAMRRILIESARAGKCLKRGGDLQRSQLTEHISLPEDSLDDLIDIDAGLEHLREVDEVAAELVKLRLFAGMSVSEAGKTLRLSRTAAYENWKFAKAWIQANMLSATSDGRTSIMSELSTNSE